MQFPASESSANFPALLGEGDGSHIQCRRRNTFLDFARVASRGSPRALTEEPRDTQWRTVYQLQGIAEWRATHLSMHRARSQRRRLTEKRRRERQGKKQRRRDRASEISLGRTGSSKDHCESARLEPVGGATHVGSVCLESKEIVDQQLLGAAVELNFISCCFNIQSEWTLHCAPGLKKGTAQARSYTWFITFRNASAHPSR